MAQLFSLVKLVPDLGAGLLQQYVRDEAVEAGAFFGHGMVLG
jgi:hypothetical protein